MLFQITFFWPMIMHVDRNIIILIFSTNRLCSSTLHIRSSKKSWFVDSMHFSIKLYGHLKLQFFSPSTPSFGFRNKYKLLWNQEVNCEMIRGKGLKTPNIGSLRISTDSQLEIGTKSQLLLRCHLYFGRIGQVRA